MKFRIFMWAGAGFLVAGFWALYFLLHAPIPMTSAEPAWILARLTCPVALFSFLPISVWWSLLINSATYALVGLIAGILRRQLVQAKY